MKAGISTGLRVAAWSASSLIVVGSVAGAASAATSHTHHSKHAAKLHVAAKHAARDDDGGSGTTTGTTSSPGTGGTSGSGSTTGSANPQPAGPPRILHGSATIETKDGTYETYAIQTGTVSAASATSITVKSSDGYSATYAVGDDTHVLKDGSKSDASDIATGDTVSVEAEQEDGGYTAELVMDGKPTAGTRPTTAPSGRPTAVPTGTPTDAPTGVPTAAPGGNRPPGGFGFGFGQFGPQNGPGQSGDNGAGDGGSDGS